MVNIYEISKDAPMHLLQEIADLLLEQNESLGFSHEDGSVMKMIELIIEDNSQSYLFIAKNNEQLVGYAFFNVSISLEISGKYIWLNDLYVQKDYRNQGIAKRLLLHIIHWAEQEGIKGIEVETGINNEATKALYNSLGFYEIVSKRYSSRL